MKLKMRFLGICHLKFLISIYLSSSQWSNLFRFKNQLVKVEILLLQPFFLSIWLLIEQDSLFLLKKKFT